MALRVVCPSCSSEYTVPDELRGKRGRCRTCATSFVLGEEPQPLQAETARALPEEEPERPTRPKPPPDRDWGDDEESQPPRRERRARKRSRAVLLLVVVGGTLITLLALVGAGLGVWYHWKSRLANAESSSNAADDLVAPADAIRAFWAAALPSFNNRPLSDENELDVGPAPLDEAGRGERRPATASPSPRPKEPPLSAVGSQLTGEALQKVQRATFYLRVLMANGQGGTGSGFLADESGVVVTNAHVVGMKEPGSAQPKAIEVFVNSGERGEKKLKGVVIGVDRDQDLALVRIDRRALPRPLTVKTAADLQLTQPLWTSGFPRGEELGKNVTVTYSPVSSLRKQNGVLNLVQVHGDMIPGNSGGPVVDERGDVVAVAVAIFKDVPRINFAVPGDAVLHLVQGRLAQLHMGVPFREQEATQVPVRVQMFDPLQRIRKVALDFWIGDPGRDRAPTSHPPVARESDSARNRVALNYQTASQVGEGTLTLPTLPAGKVYWIQPVFEDGRGVTHWGRGLAYKAPRPVERKPVHLARKPTGRERQLTLHQDTTLRLGHAARQLVEVGVAMQTGWRESLHEGASAGTWEVRRQYTSLSLGAQINRGKSQESPLQAQLQSQLETLSTRIQLDANWQKLGEEFGTDLSRAPAPLRSHLQALHLMTQEKLDLVAIPLPGRLVQPGQQWKAPSRPLVMNTFELVQVPPAQLDWTFTYAGTRAEQGRELAVVNLEGTLRYATPGLHELEGTATGTALLEVETGQLVGLEVRSTLDFHALIESVIPVPGRTSTELRLVEGPVQ